MKTGIPRGFTLLEVMISMAIFTFASGAFITMVRTSSESMAFEMAISNQTRQVEKQFDDMLVGFRWIAVNDTTLDFTYPSGTSTDPAKIVFRRIKGVDATGAYIWGDKLTYYWLPSEDEDPKYAAGDLTLYNPADIDGYDHDRNGVANDGVIWRKIEDADGDGKLDDLGFESFSGTTSLSVVFERVPPPFARVGGVVTPLDSFRVDVNRGGHAVTMTLKRFVNTGKSVKPDMEPRPAGVPTTAAVVKDERVTVVTAQRAYCTRN
jgi:prepilin-type N-terminal cleavage/methylation domain-containing protein